MPSGEGRQRENPRGTKCLREHPPPTRTNPSGGSEGDGFLGGSKPLKRRYEAERFCGKAHERIGRRKRRSDRPGGDKALKGEAHERWRLKEASKDAGTRRRVERVAKPLGVTFREHGNAFGTLARKGREEMGPCFRICCRAEELTRGAG